MSKATKSKWACSKCKFNDKTQPPINVTQQINPVFNITNDDFNNLTETVKFMSAKFDSFGTQLQELLSSVKQMREENQLLKEQNNKNNNEILLLVNRVNTLEQKALENCIEIVGVPEIKDENSVDTAKITISKLGVETTVKNAFRVSSKVINKPRKLVAELSSRQCSINIIINFKKVKPRGNTFHEKWGMEAIYINNYLSVFNRNLLLKTKAFAREAGFKFVWIKDSKVFIKKNEDQKAILIENETSLHKLK
ncbi:Hypothetical protein CINCED_3A020810 [Cinara cedri]|uniref:FP protein C-terminal domain-containing protein n=1 Tax=Cinara cedri TaxID=506608 RepID=A0A5E4MMR6_9HEMI|nr:Hypothetical protein CINCED_3A020810 [Cinara cedri]